MANDVTFHLNGSLTRDAEYAGTPFAAEGGNRGGSCAPGIGIATANGECKLSDWTVLDQFGNARDPQNSQHIGAAAANINVEDGADLNDTVSLTVQATGWVRNAVA